MRLKKVITFKNNNLKNVYKDKQKYLIFCDFLKEKGVHEKNQYLSIFKWFTHYLGDDIP